MRKIFLFVAALCCSAAMWAADFSAEVASGQTLYFNITDNENFKCEVTYGDGSYTSTISGDVTIPATVVNPNDTKTYTVVGIGFQAFRGCGSITSLTLPTAATFTTIGTGSWNDWCFRETNFESFVIPDNVTSFIAGQAFRGAGLKNITFGSGIPTIPADAFYGCSDLKHVVFPNSVTTFNNGEIFAETGVKYVELGNAVTSVNANTFGSKQYSWSPTNIDTIVINTVTPPTVVTDEYNYPTFYGELTNRCLVFVPSEAVTAYKAADNWKDFKYIYAIGTVLVTNTLTLSYDRGDNLERAQVYINDAAMSNGATFKGIEGETFNVRITYGNKYYGINKVMLGETDVTDQFTDNEATLTYAGDATLSITHHQIAHPYDFTEGIPSGQTLYFKIIDEVNHKVAICNQTGGRSLSGSVSAAYDGTVTEPTGNLEIPTAITHEAVEYTVEEIDTLAFNECSLTSVTIPEGIKAIRAGAFHYTHSGSIGAGMELVIPQSCTRLEVRAFQNCSYTSVNPGGAQVIEEYALRCPLTEVKATSALEELHMDAFQSSALTKVGLGENVEFVSSSAFSECSNLATVTCLATTPPDVKYEIASSYEADSWGNFDPSSATLYVPKSEGSTVLAAYQAANCWKLFGTISEIPEIPSALDNTEADTKAIKRIVNGQLLIERDGKTFNAQGTQVK